MTKVSVLMPVYNGESFLKEAIDSIIQQTYTDWELVIINDGSIDGSGQIVRSYTDTRIKYHINESNLGLIATLNKGISICKGQYIARMDADDISEPNRIEKQIEFLDKNSDYALCGCQAKIIDNDGNTKSSILNMYDNEYLQINLLFSVPFIHPGVTIRASVLKENHYSTDYKHAEDYDLWCKIAKNHKIHNLPDFLLKYRWHTQNVSVVYTDIQNETKEKIIIRQLENIGVSPTLEELFLHEVTFKQYESKEKFEREPFDQYTELSDWFLKLINANKNSNRYNNNAFIAYLWSRWIVICLAQKEYIKCINPRFAKRNPKVIYRLIKLILFLSKK